MQAIEAVLPHILFCALSFRRIPYAEFLKSIFIFIDGDEIIIFFLLKLF